MKSPQERKTVLITGGSSGIGYELSKYFVIEGYRILWVSKPKDELSQSKDKLYAAHKGADIYTLTQDLSLSDGPTKVKDWVIGHGWHVNVLVNNAGYGTYGYVKDQDIQKELSMIDLHIKTLYHLTRLFLDDMIKADEGTIINLSSISAFQPIPKMCTYASTKAFVKHFSLGLQEELRMTGSNVNVLSACPAAISNTPFKSHEDMHHVKTFQGIAATTVEEVGADIWSAFNKKKDLQVSGKKARRLMILNKLLPLSYQKKLIKQETEKI